MTTCRVSSYTLRTDFRVGGVLRGSGPWATFWCDVGEREPVPAIHMSDPTAPGSDVRMLALAALALPAGVLAAEPLYVLVDTGSSGTLRQPRWLSLAVGGTVISFCAWLGGVSRTARPAALPAVRLRRPSGRVAEGVQHRGSRSPPADHPDRRSVAAVRCPTLEGSNADVAAGRCHLAASAALGAPYCARYGRQRPGCAA